MYHIHSPISIWRALRSACTHKRDIRYLADRIVCRANPVVVADTEKTTVGMQPQKMLPDAHTGTKVWSKLFILCFASRSNPTHEPALTFTMKQIQLEVNLTSFCWLYTLFVWPLSLGVSLPADLDARRRWAVDRADAEEG